MDLLFEQKVVQNTALGAEAIWCAVTEASSFKDHKNGVPFHLVFIVLPIVFHKKTAEVLSKKTKPSALYKTISEHKEFLAGLQDRMEAMADRTYRSLDLCFRSGLLEIKKDGSFNILSKIKNNPIKHEDKSVRMIIASAKRVGQSFAEMPQEQIFSLLNLSF